MRWKTTKKGSPAQRRLASRCSSPLGLHLRPSLILIRVLSVPVPGLFLISMTPLRLLFLLVSKIFLPFLVSLSLTFLISPGETFAVPKANRILLGTNANRSMRLAHEAPWSWARLQAMGTRHLDPVHGMGFCGVAGTASTGDGGGGGGGGQIPATQFRARLYSTVSGLKKDQWTRIV